MLQRTDYLEKTREQHVAVTRQERVQPLAHLAPGTKPCPVLGTHAQASHWSVALSFPAHAGEFNFHFHLAPPELGGDPPLVCGQNPDHIPLVC